MMRHVCRLALSVLVGAGGVYAHAQHAHHHAAGLPAATAAAKVTASAIPAKACRKGAFTDAMALVNASVRASRDVVQTGSGKSTVAMAELDAIVGIAIDQAAAEYECVKGTLVLGYDKNFADTAKLAWNHAKARKMSPAHIQQAAQLMAVIELTGAPAKSGQVTHSAKK
jgi:hypothetical protein